ncbi:MAG: endolytic transglycosylase MltG [Patescibacteria group bacterium]
MNLTSETEKKIFIFLLGIVLFAISAWAIAPPATYPVGSIINIPEGVGLYVLSRKLVAEKVIRSPFWFRAAAIMLGGEYRMKAGEYYLSRPQNPFVIAWRIVYGKHDIKSFKLTVPEGFTVKSISTLFDDKFLYFDNALFEKIAPEGYLFPDTYFVPVTATASTTIKLMRDNFIRKIFPLMPEVELSGKSLEEIIIMASLLEAEVKTKEEREVASGILWKRLKMGMPLQVDSERGTYESQGLPEKPINNPGLISIAAATHPTTTPYLYFLTDKEGEMHTARTFDEHQTNIAKYLR